MAQDGSKLLYLHKLLQETRMLNRNGPALYCDKSNNYY